MKRASGNPKHGCSINRCKVLQLDGAYTLSQMVASIRACICAMMHGDGCYRLKEKTEEENNIKCMELHSSRSVLVDSAKRYFLNWCLDDGGGECEGHSVCLHYCYPHQTIQ